MATVDFDNVNDYPVLPAATYRVRVKKFEKKNSKAGNPMVQWTGIVIEGPQMGSAITDFCTLTDAAVWKIAKFIREMCLFSRHDVTSDPPFSKLDLVCCRNLLIYFDSTLQKHAPVTRRKTSAIPAESRKV